MIVVDDVAEADDDSLVALVITGDGRTEYRRLRPLCEHYNEDKQLLLPSTTERHLTMVGRQNRHPDTERRGWDALEAVRLYTSNYGSVTRYLFVIDSEHCADSGRAELEEKVSELADDEDAVAINQVDEQAYTAQFPHGSRDVVIHTAVVGDRFGFFEDCLAELLALEWGNEIQEEDKDEFKSSVNTILSGSQARTLLRDASRENLDRAFPSLSAVLQHFEE